MRASWAAGWLEDRANEGAVRLGELREALGGLKFAAGPMEFIRPFPGPALRVERHRAEVGEAEGFL